MSGIDKGIDFFIHVYFLSAIRRISDHHIAVELYQINVDWYV